MQFAVYCLAAVLITLIPWGVALYVFDRGTRSRKP